MSSRSRTAAPVDGALDTRLLRAAGRTLRVCVRPGNGTRTPLLLINGIGAPLELLQPFVDALDPEWEVIRFDVPGIGGSPLPVVPYSMGTLSIAVSSLLRQLGHTQAVDVMGFSWGGGLAQHLAVQHPRTVRRLVLAATATGAVMVPARPTVLLRMLTPRRHRDPYYAARIAADLYGGSMRTDPQQAAQLLHTAAERGPQRGYYYQLAAAAGWSSLPFLPLLRQRTLVLIGDDDPLIPTINGRIMERLLANGMLHIYRGGHLAVLSDATTLAPVVERFLSD